MATSTQSWSIADGSLFLTQQGAAKDQVTNLTELNAAQQARVTEAFGLWDDVSGFTPIQAVDDDNLARDTTTWVVEFFIGIPTDAYWKNSLPNEWTRVVLGDIAGPQVLGVNKSYGDNGRYHELYIDQNKSEGIDTFELGSKSFYVLLHELGHSIVGPHISGGQTQAVMNDEYDARAWNASTPMTLDIDAAIRQFGAATTTRTGDDTYGFNAHFSSGPHRYALDFDVNTRPLVTIYDNGGIDTLDASGFRDASGAARGVQVDLNPGGRSWTIDGETQTFAVIYQGIGPTTWIENAVGGGGNDVLRGNSVLNTLWGGDGHDWLDGQMDGYVDNLIGGNGNDTYSVTEYENVVEFEGGGTDTVETASTVFFLQNNVENLRYFDNTDASLYFVGNGLDNNIEGRAGDDYLIGDNGDDVLDGGAGGDTMDGGNGNDTYIVDNVRDEVIEAPNWQFVDFGTGPIPLPLGGTDTVHTKLQEYTLGANVENLTFGDDMLDLMLPWMFFEPTRHTGQGNELDNVMEGSRGRDTLFGENGNDMLKGGGGADWMFGGAGNDAYFVDNFDDVASETTYSPYGFMYDSGGIDEIFTNLPFFMLQDDYDSVIENLTYTGSETFIGIGNSVRNIITGGDGGSANEGDLLFGAGGDDWIYGGDGGDTIIGGAGSDGLDGGNGNDKFTMDNGTEIGGDVAVGGDGRDAVTADESVAATGLRLNLFAEGTAITAAVNLVPNTSAAIDVEEVHGGTGNDWIDASRLSSKSVAFEGLGGDDTFLSGGASDVFDGGANSDTIVYSGPASNYDIRQANPAVDWYDSSWFFITDRTTGIVDGVHDVELVRFNGVTAALAATSRITGTEGADVLVGDAANNIMEGLGGDDELRGGAGADSFDGGAGRDIMYVDAQDISIRGGDGFDIVYADASTAATGLHFAHAGTGVEAAFGGAGNDVLDASGAANYYNMSFGGAGNDVLIASSAGNYTMQGGAGFDIAVFAGNQAEYTIDGGTPIGWPSWLRVTNNATGAVSWLQTVEQLQFADGTIAAPLPLNALGTAGADVINAAAGGEVIHGLAGDDRLTGGSGEDELDGGAGADRMSGGAGNDSFFIDNSDTLVDGGDGYDSVYVDDSQGGPGSVRFALAGTNVEFAYGGVGSDVFDASGVSSTVELWGQWGDDVLTGGFGDDTLLGDEWLPGGGNDLLDGGAGNDWLDGGNGNDTFVVRLGSGVDTVGDFGQAGDRDVIRIVGGPFASFAALAASGAMVQSGANVVITLSASDQITLRNVQLGTLDASDFLFTNQAINGTSNADTLSGQGSDTIHGFGGNDLILGTGNTGVAFGDEGGDQLYFQGDQNQLSGGEGNDWLGVNGNNNALMGGAGDESWIGASGNGNTLAGGDGGDALFANGTGNYLHGETGNDWLGVSGSQNRLYGGAGSEWMGASGNGNLLFGGEGGDTLFSVGTNVLYGETGDDWIGCSGNGNVLNGAQGNDYLAASGNNNTLDGGAGNDILLAGGAHSGDRFVFHVGYGMDTVVNFSRHGAGGSDVVDLNGFGLNFSSLQGYMADVGGNCVITLDAATNLTIDGISKGHLLASDFLF